MHTRSHDDWRTRITDTSRCTFHDIWERDIHTPHIATYLPVKRIKIFSELLAFITDFAVKEKCKKRGCLYLSLQNKYNISFSLGNPLSSRTWSSPFFTDRPKAAQPTCPCPTGRARTVRPPFRSTVGRARPSRITGATNSASNGRPIGAAAPGPRDHQAITRPQQSDRKPDQRTHSKLASPAFCRRSKLIILTQNRPTIFKFTAGTRCVQ